MVIFVWLVVWSGYVGRGGMCLHKGERREGFDARFLTCDCAASLTASFLLRHVWQVHIY